MKLSRAHSIFASLTALAVGTAAFALWPSTPWVPTPMVGVQMQCFTETKPRPWSFCLHQVPGSQNHDLIYYFHGRNGDAKWWNDETFYSGEVNRLWKEHPRDAPTVVSISFGPLWVLTSADNGLLPVLTQQVMPRVEAHVAHAIERRMAVGESMGGINALVVALKTNGLFSKVAALCPPLPTVSGFASLTETFDYVRRTTTSLRHAAMMLWFSRKFYATDDEWIANNPVPLSRKPNALGGTELYLSCGAKDDWGCQEGAEAMVANLKQQGARVDWHLRPGGHCDIDTQSLAVFLGEPPSHAAAEETSP